MLKKVHRKIKDITVSEKTLNYLFLGILLFISLYTRFYNLGYSDYIGDEHKAFIELRPQQIVTNFFFEQRKGPMQFLVSHIPYLITGDFRNELAQRIPFAVISVVAILVFYFAIKKLTKSMQIAFLSAFLLCVNGFIVGFGRIAQYQNLNLLFSFLALFFYTDLLDEHASKKYLKSSLLGTMFWCLSMLSHWDAVFLLPAAVIIYTRFLLRKNVDNSQKIKLVVCNLILGLLLLVPFLAPYVHFQINNPDNMQYFSRRIEFGHVLFERYKLLINLYNPFLTYYLLLSMGILGAILVKKSYMFSAWFLFAYGTFELFVRKPGTHIYNFIIPLTVLAAMGIAKIYEVLPKYFKVVWSCAVVSALVFLTYQTHFFFIDHASEYPWQQKTLVDFYNLETKIYDRKKVKTRDRVYHSLTTPEYSIDQKLPLFGFPHKRYWNEINEYVQNTNRESGENLPYMTNEVKTVSEWYMDTAYGADRPFYLIGVKRPLSFFNDYKYPQFSGKTTVREICAEDGETVVRIYRVSEKD